MAQHGYPQQQQQQQQPPASPPSNKAGCMGTLVVILGGLIAVVFAIKACDKSGTVKDTSAASLDGSTPTPSGSASSSALSAPSAVPGVVLADAGPGFDPLWSSASDVGEAKLESVLTSVMDKASYCRAFKCGDEFSRDEAWTAAKEEAKRVQAGLWRAELPAARVSFLGALDRSGAVDKAKPGFVVEEWVPEKKEFPVSVVWPIELAHTKCAPTRPQTEQFVNGAGNDERKWKQFDTKVISARFTSPEEARAWKTDPKSAPVLRVVFRVTTGAYDSWKADAIYDFGAKGVVLIKPVAVQLVDRGAAIAERADSIPKK